MPWICPKCFIRVPMEPHEFPIKCHCGFSETLDAAVLRNPKLAEAAKASRHWIACPHRGQSLATVNARKAGCGCGSSVVEVYPCERFNEPVLKQSAPRCKEALAAEIPGYTGRTCRECIQAD